MTPLRGTDAPYFVWRRDDGYVAATRYAPKSGGFSMLLITEDWAEAYALIASERAKPSERSEEASPNPSGRT